MKNKKPDKEFYGAIAVSSEFEESLRENQIPQNFTFSFADGTEAKACLYATKDVNAAFLLDVDFFKDGTHAASTTITAEKKLSLKAEAVINDCLYTLLIERGCGVITITDDLNISFDAWGILKTPQKRSERKTTNSSYCKDKMVKVQWADASDNSPEDFFFDGLPYEATEKNEMLFIKVV